MLVKSLPDDLKDAIILLQQSRDLIYGVYGDYKSCVYYRPQWDFADPYYMPGCRLTYRNPYTEEYINLFCNTPGRGSSAGVMVSKSYIFQEVTEVVVRHEYNRGNISVTTSESYKHQRVLSKGMYSMPNRKGHKQELRIVFPLWTSYCISPGALIT